MTTRTIVIAGTHSGTGKTTIATGLMGALSGRGLKVQPFKSGPDYIDPTYHTKVTGAPSRNLDTWLISKPHILELFGRAVRNCDIAVIEGVMGLYDGRYPVGDEGSTAELAKLLGAPVILIVDARSAARSAAAMVLGFKDMDPDLNLAGVILNGIGSMGHYDICREAVEHYTGIPVVGYMPRRKELTMPERHLGLVPTVEGGGDDDFLTVITDQCAETLDIDRILELSEQADTPPVEPELFPAEPVEKQVKIGVARDRAFSFYYQDSLDLLEAWGAELIPFSPMEDTGLPEGMSGLYIGGGFPELYAETLAGNSEMLQAVVDAAKQGMPVYAECGGLMYLGEQISDFDGKTYKMAGLLPMVSQINSPKLSLGYRTVTALQDGPLLKKGESSRGHEFHWSVVKEGSDQMNAYTIREQSDRVEGFQDKNILASYVHIHFASAPNVVKRYIENCRRFSETTS